jgi:hypothetical protein
MKQHSPHNGRVGVDGEGSVRIFDRRASSVLCYVLRRWGMAPARILAHIRPVASVILASLPYFAVAAAFAYFLYPAIH